MESFCGSSQRTNVASFSCDQARKFPNKLIIGSKAFVAGDAVDSDTFRAALLAASILDTGNSDKLFAVNVLQDPNETTEANKTGAVGEGVAQVLVEGKPAFTYRVEIGQDLFKRLRKLNKQRIPIFTYDDAGNLWGAKDSTTGNFIGCEAQFFISGNTQQTASTPVSALITISYTSARQYNDDAVYMPVVLSEFEPAGLLDAILRIVSNTTNVWKIAVEAPTAQYATPINLATKYQTQLAVVGAWLAATGATFGTPLTMTSVAYDSTLKVMTITFDSTAYTALSAATKIKLSLALVATLVGLGVSGIEGVPVILTK
jgi:hypothetical protein